MNDKDREHLARHLNLYMSIYFQNCMNKKQAHPSLGHFLTDVIENMTNVDVIRKLGDV